MATMERGKVKVGIICTYVLVSSLFMFLSTYIFFHCCIDFLNYYISYFLISHSLLPFGFYNSAIYILSFPNFIHKIYSSICLSYFCHFASRSPFSLLFPLYTWSPPLPSAPDSFLPTYTHVFCLTSSNVLLPSLPFPFFFFSPLAHFFISFPPCSRASVPSISITAFNILNSSFLFLNYFII